MFTGIVDTARVAALEDRPGSRLLRVDLEAPGEGVAWRGVANGESIAINGVCLTVVEAKNRSSGAEAAFEVVPETLQRTNLGAVRAGERVNIERSLAVGDLFGGHYVTGHVDGVGTVRARHSQGDQLLFEIEAPPALLRQVIPKGSVAVDGISLTVVDVDRSAGWFSFAAIPHTLERTVLAARTRGVQVNLETDAFGKWVLHYSKEAAEEPGADERLLRSLELSGYLGRSRWRPA